MFINNKKCFSIVACILSLMLLLTSCGSIDSVNDSSVSDNQDITSADTVSITFPEGFTVVQIAERLEENEVCSKEAFIEEVNNREYLSEFDIDISNPEKRVYLLEGYLFPDTYEFFKGESAVSVIKKFLRNTQSKLNDDIKDRAKALGYSVDEIIILASIIQGESGGGTEAKNVSSVIHNRLNNNPPIKLQCDAGVTYLKRYVKPYYDEDTYYEYCLDYNTYNCDGLSVGAINNPGISSIEAALYPNDTNYYYFLTDSDGVYYYSETLEGHNLNKAKAGL